MKRIEDYNKKLPVNELYVAVQGEGSRAGMPTIVIRTIGCNLRCYFGEKGGFCDSWANSWKLEKGQFTFQDVINLYDANPHITEMMITGGGPTKHPALINELCIFAKSRSIFTTMETEVSEWIETEVPIDLISMSPKFSNSIPVVGVTAPWGQEVTQKEVDRHEKFRINDEAVTKMMELHNDYHYKPVWDCTERGLEELEQFRVRFNIPKNKTYVMPAGDSRQGLLFSYPATMEMCMAEGYNFTGRPHIIAYDKKRCV